MDPIKEESVAEPSSQTAQDFLKNQLQLEAEAREVLPYQFDTCTKPIGPLRQQVFSCLTCNPPPADVESPSFTPAGVCYACSISCHGEHELVELFTRRNFVCDCGTTRLPSTSPCTLRADASGAKGNVHSEEPAAINSYNHNFRNRFCGCAELYDPGKERGTMFQCLGLGTVEEGGCGEDWWHPECLMGLARDWRKGFQPKATVGETGGAEHKTKESSNPAQGEEPAEEDEEEDEYPPGFPDEDKFDHFICYKCVEAFPWIKKYSTSTGFTAALEFNKDRTLPTAAGAQEPHNIIPNGAPSSSSLKRKAEDDADDDGSTQVKRSKSEEKAATDGAAANVSSDQPVCKYAALSEPGTSRPISLFLAEDFRDHLCRCPACFPALARHPQLLEEETAYSPPLSEGSSDAGGAGAPGSAGSSRSLLDRGEAALSNMDRVRAIEGVMAYNHLRDNLKGFLKPFADSGTPVSADDIKAHFEKLRGDSEAIRAARMQGDGDGDGGDGDGDNRREQSGY